MTVLELINILEQFDDTLEVVRPFHPESTEVIEISDIQNYKGKVLLS